MSKVLYLVDNSDHFNQIIVNFIQYQPYNQMNEIMNQSIYGSRRNTEDVSLPFFETSTYIIDQDMENPLKIITHEIRLDGNQKPKSFYKLQLLPSQGGHREITLEKVYGDFKRLHVHIEETFKNELKEFQRIDKATSNVDVNSASKEIEITTLEQKF